MYVCIVHMCMYCIPHMYTYNSTARVYVPVCMLHTYVHTVLYIQLLYKVYVKINIILCIDVT
jgi:hypothetical protein